jgi:hypothetical protein
VRGRVGPVALGVQRIWKLFAEPPGYRSKDDHLRWTFMCIDGPQSVTVSTTVWSSREKAGLGLGITLTGLVTTAAT